MIILEDKKAVALRYRKVSNDAPEVIAKGMEEVAEKIIEIAEKENIPIVEDEDAVNEFYGVDINSEIPPEMYQIAAEIFAYIYKLESENRDMGGDQY